MGHVTAGHGFHGFMPLGIIGVPTATQSEHFYSIILSVLLVHWLARIRREVEFVFRIFLVLAFRGAMHRSLVAIASRKRLCNLLQLELAASTSLRSLLHSTAINRHTVSQSTSFYHFH